MGAAGGPLGIGLGASGNMMSSAADWYNQRGQAGQSRDNYNEVFGNVGNQQNNNLMWLNRAEQDAANNYNSGENIIKSYGDQARGAINSGTYNGLEMLRDQFGNATNAINNNYADARSTLNPLTRTAGLAAEVGNTRLGEGFQQSPGYQFQLQQGQEAMDRLQASRGGRFSGEALKEATKYSQGMANQDYNQFVQNQLAQNQQKLSAANMGYSAASQLAGLDANQGNVLSGLYGRLGESGSALEANRGNALAGIYGGVGSQVGGMEQRFGDQIMNGTLQTNAMNTNLMGDANRAASGQLYSPSLTQGYLSVFGNGLSSIGGGMAGYGGGVGGGGGGGFSPQFRFGGGGGM